MVISRKSFGFTALLSFLSMRLPPEMRNQLKMCKSKILDQLNCDMKTRRSAFSENESHW